MMWIRQRIFFILLFLDSREGTGKGGGRGREDRKTDVRREGKEVKGGASELIINTN